MMAPTHAYIGATLALVSMPVTGSYAAPSGILAASFLGGVLPDFDLVTSHRKTLHFPVLYPVAACLLAVLSLALGWQSLFLPSGQGKAPPSTSAEGASRAGIRP
jgi:hypothetical protein